MAVSLLTFASSEVTVQRKDAYLTRAFNQHNTGLVARGVYRGFILTAGTFPNLGINVDPATGDSVAVVEIANDTEKYSLTIRKSSNFTLDLTAFAGQEIVIALTATYTTTSVTSAEIKAYTVAEYETDLLTTTGATLVALGTVRVPVSGPLGFWSGVSGEKGFTYFRRTYAAQQEGSGALVWTDVIANGSFEQGVVASAYYRFAVPSWDLPDLTGGSYFHLAAPSPAAKGVKVLSLYGVNPGSSTGIASQWLGIPVNPGQSVRLGASIKILATASGTFKMFLEWGTADNAILSTTDVVIPVGATTGGVYKQIHEFTEIAPSTYRIPDTFTVPASAVLLRRVGISCSGLAFGSTGDHIYIDDFRCFIEAQDTDHRSPAESKSGATIAAPLIIADPNEIFTGGYGTVWSYDSLGSNNLVTVRTLENGTTTLDINRVTGLAAPTVNSDAATKQYVDSVATGLVVHNQVKLATAAQTSAGYNYTNGVDGEGAFIEGALFGVLSVDGVTLTITDKTNSTRILVKDQSDSKHNGIYVVTEHGDGGTKYKLTRAADATNQRTASDPGGLSAGLQGGSFVMVQAGTANADTGWVVSSPDNIFKSSIGAPWAIFNTDSIVWSQFSQAGVLEAGSGLLKTGTPSASIFDVELDTGADAASPSSPANTGGTSGIEFHVTGTAGRLRAAVNPTGGLSRQTGGLGILVNATGGLQTGGSGASIKIHATGGLTTDSSGLLILGNPAVTDPGAVTGTIALSGAGLKVVGLPQLFHINDVAVGSGVTAANLSTLTTSDVTSAHLLHTHSSFPASVRPDFLGGLALVGGYGTLSPSSPANRAAFGAGGGGPTDSVSMCFGNSTGFRFVIGTNLASVFTPRFYLSDKGELIVDNALAPNINGQIALTIKGDWDTATPTVGSGPQISFVDSTDSVDLGRIGGAATGSALTDRHIVVAATNQLYLQSIGTAQIDCSGNKLRNVSSAGGNANNAVALDTAPATNDIPKWNGTNWIPVPIPGGGGGGDITEVNTTGGIQGGATSGAVNLSLVNNAQLVNDRVARGSGSALYADDEFRAYSTGGSRTFEVASSGAVNAIVRATRASGGNLLLNVSNSGTSATVENTTGDLYVNSGSAANLILTSGNSGRSLQIYSHIESVQPSGPTLGTTGFTAPTLTPVGTPTDTRGSCTIVTGGTASGSITITFPVAANFTSTPHALVTMYGNNNAPVVPSFRWTVTTSVLTITVDNPANATYSFSWLVIQ